MAPQPSLMDPETAAFVAGHRVARLATADAGCLPHVVPISYAFDGRHLYSALDLKPKTVAGPRLKRVRNIQENPRVAVVIDDYSEDWSALGYVLIHGTVSVLEAAVFENGDERSRAETMLREKYPQYEDLLERGCTILKITPLRVTSWGRVYAPIFPV